MTPRPKATYPKSIVLTLRISEDMAQALQQVFERDGVAISEQVRRGVRLWLESRGVMTRTRRPSKRRA